MAHTQPGPSTTCLFCHHPSPTLEANTSHMFRSHGFLIPHQDRLLVDVSMLLEYLDSIIEEDKQCIHCFTQRSSGEAVRQHMMGKGHHILDLEEGSEYADFYQSNGEDDEDDEDAEGEGESDSSARGKKGKEAPFLRLDDGSVRLRSGRIVSHRKATPARPANRRPLRDTTSPAALGTKDDSPSASPEPSDYEPSTSTRSVLTPALAHGSSNSPPPPSRHELALSHMRHSDRTALAHLPAAQQRALLATQRQQATSAARAQQTAEASLAGKGNKTLMKYFKPKVPKRKNGLHRESLKA